MEMVFEFVADVVMMIEMVGIGQEFFVVIFVLLLLLLLLL
jgi:hypothetical protein